MCNNFLFFVFVQKDRLLFWRLNDEASKEIAKALPPMSLIVYLALIAKRYILAKEDHDWATDFENSFVT